ncbi:hypothetical protein COT47_01960 [Candidatus Woesearchaeota archaeon CG08_land_8_20_14_0_20_43_7]|nr:MAG: hypothetical protein COT47_01960 [Candidatus Woesearchaeota archaeon CG08_land_8_20_14_0_20_43_7]
MDNPYTSRHIVAEGIDGCGKGTAVEAMKLWAEENNLWCFDLGLFCRRHKRFPRMDEIEQQVIIAQEPTYAPVGRTIRQVLTKVEGYSAKTLAHAFALDREMYYRDVVIPAKEAGKFIFQERCVMSTLAYQGTMDPELTEYVLDLEGNRLALKNGPDLVLHINVDVSAAIRRIEMRSDERNISRSIFENADFLIRVKERFKSTWLRDLMEMHSIRVVDLDNDFPKSQESFKHEVVKLLSRMRL